MHGPEQNQCLKTCQTQPCALRWPRGVGWGWGVEGILKCCQSPHWADCLHFTQAWSSFSAALESALPAVPFPPKASLPALRESALCCTWGETVSSVSIALLLGSQRERGRGRSRVTIVWLSSQNARVLWSYPIFEVSSLPPSPSGFEVVISPAFVLREPLRDTAVISTLEPLSGGTCTALAETLKLGHASRSPLAAKQH